MKQLGPIICSLKWSKLYSLNPGFRYRLAAGKVPVGVRPLGCSGCSRAPRPWPRQKCWATRRPFQRKMFCWFQRPKGPKNRTSWKTHTCNKTQFDPLIMSFLRFCPYHRHHTHQELTYQRPNRPWRVQGSLSRKTRTGRRPGHHHYHKRGAATSGL